ncbi:MAG: hypothetical protein FRX49_02375 [Trebouxia sp. A1-2]|nr:MAG: hypothetical protein FRX49_02375 [Trebouxia sp. A1-2]
MSTLIDVRTTRTDDIITSIVITIRSIACLLIGLQSLPRVSGAGQGRAGQGRAGEGQGRAPRNRHNGWGRYRQASNNPQIASARRAGQGRAGQGRAGRGRQDRARSKDRAGHQRAAQARQGRAGQGRAELGREGRGRAGQDISKAHFNSIHARLRTKAPCEMGNCVVGHVDGGIRQGLHQVLGIPGDPCPQPKGATAGPLIQPTQAVLKLEGREEGRKEGRKAGRQAGRKEAMLRGLLSEMLPVVFSIGRASSSLPLASYLPEF